MSVKQRFVWLARHLQGPIFLTLSLIFAYTFAAIHVHGEMTFYEQSLVIRAVEFTLMVLAVVFSLNLIRQDFEKLCEEKYR